MLRRSAIAAVLEIDLFGVGGPIVGVRVDGVTLELVADYEDVRDWVSQHG
jgi:hypothetical protein